MRWIAQACRIGNDNCATCRQDAEDDLAKRSKPKTTAPAHESGDRVSASSIKDRVEFCARLMMTAWQSIKPTCKCGVQYGDQINGKGRLPALSPDKLPSSIVKPSTD